jgi:hypothetical protein
MQSFVETGEDRRWLEFLSRWSLLAGLVILSLMVTFLAGVRRGLSHGRGQGVGLSSMRERAEELGGVCRGVPASRWRSRAGVVAPRGSVRQEQDPEGLYLMPEPPRSGSSSPTTIRFSATGSVCLWRPHPTLSWSVRPLMEMR